MASILKVDTIQDQDGNNIINESADTITIGASGDTITIPSGATLTNNGTQTGLTLSDNILFNTANKGIYLGVTTATASNLLDDYEEGTWTPDVYHSSSNNSTWSSKTGSYTKIGNKVTAWGVCDGGNSGTAGSDLTVTLPFTASGVNITCGGSAVYNGTSHGDTLGWQLINANTARLYIASGYHTNQVTYIGFFVTFTVA